MSVGAFDSLIHRGLFSDDVVAPLFDDRQQIRAMLETEAALARAQAKTGLIPAGAAERITDVAASLEVEPSRLADGTTSSGVPVGPLVAELREVVGEDDASWVHWGATSQDIVDTALMMRLATALDILDERLERVTALLDELARRHADTAMTARTRSQAAVPTSFGLKAAGWGAPLH